MRRAIISAPLGALITGGLMVALVLAVPESVSPSLALALGGMLATTTFAVRKYLVDRSVAWFVTVAGIGFAVACAGAVVTMPSDAVDLAATIVGLVATGTVVVGLHRLFHVRSGSVAEGVFGDALIVGLGTWIVTWVTLIHPRLDQAAPDQTLAVIDSFQQPLSAIALFLLALLLFTEHERRPSIWFLGGAVTTAIAGQTVHALHTSGYLGSDSVQIGAALTVAGLAFAAAAVTHPTADSLLTTQTVSRTPRVMGRLVITTSSLVVPLIILAVTEPDSGPDKMMRSVSAIVLAGSVTVRVIQSIQAANRAQQDLLRSVQTDPLTGLPNRSLLLDRISSCVNESWRSDRIPTIFFVDLDRFKNINDSLGHASGDEVLRIVAERLTSAAPHGATVARLSGDEFVVLDPTIESPEMATDLADQLLSVFREPLALSQGDVFVTASIGVASITTLGARPEDMLRHADTAMYRAKDAGRNCMAFYDESMHERVAHRLAVETALYRALDRRELRLFHQPILEMATGEVVGFEALMRWQQSDGTIVSPAEFIPIAEDTGTIVPIGAWALLEALSQLRRWIDDGICSPQATMSVNVSPRQLADPSFASIVSEALLRSGMGPESLWLEITESVMISEPELALSTLEQMQELGVRTALDDFGTGYSSLSLLQRFPLQRIKIDRAFVQGVADNPSDRSLVRTIVAMCVSLDLDMVAEGVETLKQMQVLHELGCGKAQGYLISRPVPSDAMRSTVAALERLGDFPLLRGQLRAGQM
jgi:diguanylate cyclase (GGDEF)-like protein